MRKARQGVAKISVKREYACRSAGSQFSSGRTCTVTLHMRAAAMRIKQRFSLKYSSSKVSHQYTKKEKKRNEMTEEKVEKIRQQQTRKSPTERMTKRVINQKGKIMEKGFEGSFCCSILFHPLFTDVGEHSTVVAWSHLHRPDLPPSQ